MISPDHLRSCHDLNGLQSLLCSLGYAADARRVDPEEWRGAGIELPAAPLYLLARAGAVDLFAFENGAISREALSPVLAALRARNPLRKQVFFHLQAGEAIELLDAGPHGRLRKLRIELRDPRPQDVDRWNMLELRNSSTPVVEIFERALDRQQITRTFFRRFREARANLAEALAGVAPSETGADTRAQALLILSRILFLYFIQEKGWLNGERRFLVERLQHARAARRRFFTSVLHPLFFGCLNTPAHSRSPEAAALGRIPYLNGGLFEPSRWEQRHREAAVSNELMADIIESLFERFSFSVDEGEEESAQVDPEMLGKVFEALMESDERRASGSFYTPREIVDSVTRGSIGAAIGFDGCEDGCTPGQARGYIARLRSLRVLDPACGSGAFLLGALREMERLFRQFAKMAGEGPDARQRIVERSLFGVDLKPEAVSLCELRLWLAIVSQSTLEIEDVPPLPNLDRNILQGNSLLSPLDFLGDGRIAIYRGWSSALKKRNEEIERYRIATAEDKPLLARALRASDQHLAGALLDAAILADQRELQEIHSQRALGGTERRQSDGERALRERIGRLESEREEVERGRLSFFAFDIHFAQVIQQGGFDLVLGNPPWVRSSRIDPASRCQYSERYEFFRGAGTGFRQSDLALAFFEKALALTRPDGVLSLLMPAKLLNAGYARRLRRALATEHQVMNVRDWSDEATRLFEADTFPLTITVRRGGGAGSLHAASEGRSFLVAQSDLAGSNGEEWSLLTPEVRRIVERIGSQHAALRDVLGRAPMMGVKTGANARFFPGEVIVQGGRATLPALGCDIPLEALCRSVRGRDIRRWRAANSHWMLWPPVNGWRRDLEWVGRLATALSCEVTDLRLAFARPEHLGTKVVWKDVSKGMQAVVLPDSAEIGGRRYPLVPNQTTYFIDAADLDEAWAICAILNSTPFNALALTVVERAKDAHFRYFGTTIGGVAFPRVDRSDAIWHELVRLSRRAHRGASTDGEIDSVVGSLYGLKQGEAQILDRFVRERLRLRR